MAAGEASFVNRQKTSRGFTRALLSAVSEWMLIFLLFIDSLFSYLITKFASSCELQTPCLLCSRLDHILDKKNLKSYWGLICGNHKLEISSLVFCHAHNKLVDVHGICESCLFSFATINKSNAETYRLLVGKLGEESEVSFDQDPLLEGHEGGHSGVRHCSCCNEPWVLRGSAQKLVQTRSIGSEGVELDLPLSGAVEHYQDNLMKIDSPSVSVKVTRRSNSRLDPLSHVGYTELKINSDTESEEHFSDDDDDANGPINGANVKEDPAVHSAQLKPHIITSSVDSVLEKLIDPVSVSEPSHLESQVQSDTIESLAGTSAAHSGPFGNGLEEFSWQQADHKAELSTPAELISLEDVTSSSNGGEAPIEVAKESKPISLHELHPFTIVQEPPFDTSKEREFIHLTDVPPPSTVEENPVDVLKDSKHISLDDVPSSDPVETAVEISKENGIPRTIEIEHKSTADCNEICKVGSGPIIITETALETNNASSGNGLQTPNLLDLSDAYKLAVSNRGRQPSGILLEQWISKDSSKLSEDLKQILSQLSAARGTEFSTNDMFSPKVPINSDELKTSDASTSAGIQMLQKMISLERNESGLSLDGSIVSEIEGESVVDRLKRQVEHDRKLLSALYKELEEERNASAIAANQAMAMITRLQEEKATLHMEALQNLRMMEEQAEYDMEALNKTNDLLAEKEKEIQDLEAELEFYRNKYPNESMLENIVEPTCDLKVRDITVDQSKSTCVAYGASCLGNSDTKEPNIRYKSEDSDVSFVDKNTANVTSLLLESEDEKLYISLHLQKLEKMLDLFSVNETHSNIVNGEYAENEGHSLSELTKNDEGESELNSEIEEDTFPIKNTVSASRGNLPDQGNLSPQVSNKESSELDCDGQRCSMPPGGIDLGSLRNEFSELNDRLEALEADRNFLEHAINSLKNGEEGLRFVQEISSHLQELRSIGIRRNQTVA